MYLNIRNMIIPLALDKFQYRLVSAFRFAYYFAFLSEKLFAC